MTVKKGRMNAPAGILSADDLHYFNEGRHVRMYEKMGAQVRPEGVYFTVWTPNARAVAVTGDFNGWNGAAHILHPCGTSGLWSGLVPEARPGQFYKYRITTHDGAVLEKADPLALHAEIPPKTASVIAGMDYQWHDRSWMERRHWMQNPDKPMSIYEVHVGSWRYDEAGYPLSYRALAAPLIEHVQDMGFTHVQFMPVMEHPFHGSWGYHITGYFAPSSRYGTPQDFMYLVDCLHQADIGVILDWVPGHFPDDPHALARFDGTCLYEHEDDRRGLHPEWKSRIFNYSRHEVRSFLISSALFWLDKYHIDGLRVDAVSSMLYLDYAREPGEWIPNHLGGRENLEAVDFLRGLNRVVHENYPDARMIAEESSNWPLVSHPETMGGLGFDMKWDMGWMNDTLDYFQLDPVHRRHHQNQITFRSLYGHQEHFVLPLSHDEVVHGHGSLMGKMPGDDWQKFANLRALYSYMYALPGKKHLFMGCEIAQRDEWDHDSSIQWHLEDYPPHAGMKALLSDLNRLYRSEPAMHNDFGPEGFAWIDGDDHENSVLCFLRRDKAQRTEILCLLNFTPVPRHAYEVGVPRSGSWREILNSDSRIYGGCDCGNGGILHSVAEPRHDHDHKIRVTLPPLGALFLKWMD